MGREKRTNTSKLKIKKNTISFGNSLLQISNISHIDVEPAPKPKFCLWSVGACIIGIILMILFDEKIMGVGFLLILMGIIYIIWYVADNSNSEDTYLNIYLNSGYVCNIYCENRYFLKKAMRIIEKCFNDHKRQNVITIDFDNCNFDKSPINIDNKEKVSSTVIEGDNNLIVNNDWVFIQDELRKACVNLPKSSAEHAASEEALECALNEDGDRFVEVIKKYSDRFLSDIFTGVVSGVLVEMIKTIIAL